MWSTLHWIRRRHHRREAGDGDLSRERSASGRSVTVPLDTLQAHTIPRSRNSATSNSTGPVGTQSSHRETHSGSVVPATYGFLLVNSSQLMTIGRPTTRTSRISEIPNSSVALRWRNSLTVKMSSPVACPRLQRARICWDPRPTEPHRSPFMNPAARSTSAAGNRTAVASGRYQERKSSP